MGSVNPHSMTKTAFWMPKRLDHVLTHLSDSHDQVLYRLGEYAMFVMMWHVADFEAGLVGRCPTCYATGGANERIAKAYGGQSDRDRCPDCFGTSFEGGVRARVIRPAVVSDVNTETIVGRRGEVVTDTVAIETTSDIFVRTGDYMFRADGKRYRCAEMSTLVVRSGFDVVEREESVGGVIPSARLEDPASVAYIIPPTTDEVHDTLYALTQGRHIPADLTALDYAPGPLVP